MIPQLSSEAVRRQIADLRPGLVSFDVFDTLLWRPFRRPTDLFLHFARAANSPAAALGLEADRLARHRIEAEQQSRLAGECPEVTLGEIAGELSRRLALASPEPWVEAELALERNHLHPHADMLALVADLHREGIPYALCSDMYLPADVILDIVMQAAGRAGITLPRPRAVLVSGEQRSGKAGRLFELLVRQTGVEAGRIVHVGDNAQSDVACALRRGLQAVHVPRTCQAAEEILDAEERWMSLRARGAKDFGISTCRKELLAEATAGGGSIAQPGVYGSFVAGPFFAAFAAWVVQECRAQGISRLHGAMREGAFLARLLTAAGKALGYPLEVHTIWASRFALRSAALSEAAPDALIDFLLNVRAVDVRSDLLSQIGLLDASSREEWAANGLDGQPLPRKLAWIRRLLESRPHVLDAVRQRASVRHAGLVAHWRKHGLMDNGRIDLVDVGWGGSIQQSLCEGLQSVGWSGIVHGLYLGTDHRILRLPAGTCPSSSFLYHAGTPLEAARIVQRTPELIEQMCMSPEGSVREFTPDGDPVLFSNPLAPRQCAEAAALQDGVMEFGHRWWPRFALAGGLEASCDDVLLLADRLRAVISRSIMDPNLEEVLLFREWNHDSNNGSGDAMPLLGSTDAASLVRSGKVTHPWQLDWQVCYWPQGLFAALGRTWDRRISWRGRLMVRCGDLCARIFGRFDPWPKFLVCWVALRLRLRALKQFMLSWAWRLPGRGSRA